MSDHSLFCGAATTIHTTRTQTIRTAAAIPLQALMVDQVEVPVYLRIADQAKHLRDLGMSDRAIARALGVSDKTVAKAGDSAGPLAGITDQTGYS